MKFKAGDRIVVTCDWHRLKGESGTVVWSLRGLVAVDFGKQVVYGHKCRCIFDMGANMPTCINGHGCIFADSELIRESNP